MPLIKNARQRREELLGGETIVNIGDTVLHRKTRKTVKVVEIVNSRGQEVDFIDLNLDPDGRVEFPMEFGMEHDCLWAYCDEIAVK